MERVEEAYELAGQRKNWKAVRLAAAILGKVVDTLAPAITSMLVRGKEVSVMYVRMYVCMICMYVRMSVCMRLRSLLSNLSDL